MPTSSQKFKDWRAEFEPQLARVDAVIEELSASEVELIGRLIKHIISAGGKRLRPILTILSAQACGYSGGERHIKLAACIEFLHTATLLHDDVVDESELRRGSATANNMFGNAASVLVGDFLLSKAFQVMAQDGSLRVLSIIADASSTITQGEVAQLSAISDIGVTRAQYLDIISAKTAVLFAAACEIGAVLGAETAGDKAADAMRAFGHNLGMAFQIIDDVLDYSAKQEALGKAIGDDLREGKVTLPLIDLMEQASGKERAFIERCIKNPGADDDALPRIIAMMEEYDTLAGMSVYVRQFVDEGMQALSYIEDSQYKTAMANLLEFSVLRDY